MDRFQYHALPSPCMILKVIHTGIGWVWLVRLAWKLMLLLLPAYMHWAQADLMRMADHSALVLKDTQLPNGKDSKHNYTLQFLNLYLSSLNKRHISMDWTLVSWGLPEKATIADSTALTCLARSGLSSLVRWPSSVLWDKSQSMWLSWPPL